MGLCTKLPSPDEYFEMWVGPDTMWSVILHCYALEGHTSLCLAEICHIPSSSRREISLSQHRLRATTYPLLLRLRNIAPSWLRIMKHPKMLYRFNYIWSSVFSGFHKHRDFDRRSFGMYRRMFVIHAISCGALVTCITVLFEGKKTAYITFSFWSTIDLDL